MVKSNNYKHVLFCITHSDLTYLCYVHRCSISPAKLQQHWFGLISMKVRNVLCFLRLNDGTPTAPLLTCFLCRKYLVPHPHHRSIKQLFKRQSHCTIRFVMTPLTYTLAGSITTCTNAFKTAWLALVQRKSRS